MEREAPRQPEDGEVRARPEVRLERAMPQDVRPRDRRRAELEADVELVR
jgi:hypothetical protein